MSDRCVVSLAVQRIVLSYDDIVVLVVAAVIDGSGVLMEAAHESVGGHL